VIFCNGKDEHFLELKHEIRRRRELLKRNIKGFERAVLVFFDSKETLLEFYESSYMQPFKASTRTITETAPLNERATLFQRATNKGAITLMIRDFGRGTDFKCHDQTMLQAGGVHVIQTFFSVDASEEIQIKGRCARQGADGSFSLVIDYKQVERDLKLSRDQQDDLRKGIVGLECLNSRRAALLTKKFTKQLGRVETAEEYHYRTHACLRAMSLGEQRGDVMTYFEELNGIGSAKHAFLGCVQQLKQSVLKERRLRLQRFYEAKREQRRVNEHANEPNRDEAMQLSIMASKHQSEKARIRTVLARSDVCHFDLLGVAADTPFDAIKEAYRLLALIFHPDKNKDDDAQAIFQAIRNAMDVISDDAQREKYVRSHSACYCRD
jgi:hypothetical protein